MSLPNELHPLQLAASSGGYEIEQSLRFDGSSYLLWTPSSTGDSVRKWTISVWVKQNYATGTTAKYMISAGPNTGSDTAIYPYTYDLASDISGKYYFVQGDNTRYVRSVPSYRDESAWYHFVFQSDADNATTGDKLKIFVNGERIATESPQNAPSTQNTYWNSTNQHRIGRIGGLANWTGYMAEFHSVDNQLVDPDQFGEYDDNGVWRPIEYTGTYGSNGFYLKFDPSATNGIGHDHSGNGNNWTPTGFDTTNTTAATYDVMSDTPTTNYPTINTLAKFDPGSEASQNNSNVSNGNLEIDTAGAAGVVNNTVIANFQIPTSGKYYWEVTCREYSTAAPSRTSIGVMSNACALGPDAADFVYADLAGVYTYGADGKTGKSPGLVQSTYGNTYGVNDVIGVAFDADNGDLYFYKNGTIQNSGTAAFTGLDMTDGFYPAVGYWGDFTFNFGQRAFDISSIPSGYKALNTRNLPSPDIKDGSEYFDTTLRGPTYLQQNATFTVNINSGKSAFYGESNWLTTTPNDPTWQASGWARARREEGIGGYFDWYLPAYQELEVLYWNLKPTTDANASGVYASGSNPYAVPAHGNYGASPTQTSVSIFQEGGSEAFETRGYWASSGPSGDANAFTIQYFDSGVQLQRPSMSGAAIRVIRREAVTGSEPSIGEEYAGGYLGGYISVNQNSVATHAIIVAPKAEGELPSATMFSKAQETFANAMWWIKSRGGSNQHQLVDVVRGTTNILELPNTNAETTYTDPGETSVSWNWNVGENAGKTYTVKVVSDSGNKYRFDDFGTSAVTLSLAEGATYIFDQSDSSNSGHPLRFSTTSDGTHGAGSEYTTGVTVTGTPGQAGAKTTIVVAASAPTLYYYCSVHSGMGGQVDTTTTLGSSNFDGSIQSVVKSNPSAGFSIVSYTGNGSASATIGHGLGVKPQMVIVKSRNNSSTYWTTYHESISAGTTYCLELNSTAYKDQVIGTFFGSTQTFNSSVFSVGYPGAASNSTNVDTYTYIAYCFAEVESYSKFGNYAGNSSADGPFVYCGFKPAWLVCKVHTRSGYGWEMMDSARDTYNDVEKVLSASSNGSEGTGTRVDFLSNGFKLRTDANVVNQSGESYVFMAFAENPFGGSGISPATAR